MAITMRGCVSISLLSAALLVGLSCRAGGARSPVEVGQSYRLDMWSEDSTSFSAGTAQDAASRRKQVTLQLRVDSVQADTAFGEYVGELAALGVVVGQTPLRPNRFQLTSRGDSVELRLEPAAIDASVRLLGSASGRRQIDGQWSSEAAPRAQGSFSLSLDKRSN